MSLKSLDIAAWFVSIEPMNHEKLQCLLYLSYAWYQTLNHQDLFETDGFEALPVLIAEPIVLKKYHSYGNKKIHYIRGQKMSEAVIEFLKSVYETYGTASSEALCGYLRQSEPYLKARQNPNHFFISRKDMVTYYGKQI